VLSSNLQTHGYIGGYPWYDPPHSISGPEKFTTKKILTPSGGKRMLI